MTENYYPMGMTRFEWGEEIGEPHVWALEDDLLGIATRIKNHPAWYVEAHFRVSRGKLELMGLAVAPVSRPTRPPHPSLTQEVMRSIKLTYLFDLAEDWRSARKSIGRAIDIDSAEFKRNRRPGREGRPDSWYARLALEYLELCRTSAAPLQDLASAYGVSVSSARDFVHQARERDLLTKTKRGQKGGQLTSKARTLLSEEALSVTAATRARKATKITRQIRSKKGR